MKHQSRLLNMILAALFLALAYTLPFLTGQIPTIGAMLCPMHIPVLLCGFLCGWPWGLAVGLVAPLLRSFTLGMPMLFPMAIAMSAELAVYGAAAGLLHSLLPKKKPMIYLSLLASMILGRLVWGGAMFLLLALNSGRFTAAAFLSGALTGAIPGILLQIALIPPVIMLLERLKGDQA